MKATSLVLIAVSIIVLSSMSSCSGSTEYKQEGLRAVPGPSQATMDMLRVELERVLGELGVSIDEDGNVVGKHISSLPKRVYFTPQRWEDNGVSKLYWLNFQAGDYDQNGEVNIADLTKVGLYFGAKSTDPNWSQEAEVADGDKNGEINISDVTAIGQNFGALVDGWVIEAREAGMDWREYGFFPFSFGFPSGQFLEYGYDAPSGLIESEFRIRPAGRVRDFDWVTYPVFFGPGPQTVVEVKMATVDGKPMVSFSWYDGVPKTYCGFAIASKERPESVDDWYIDNNIAETGLEWAPAITHIQGHPILAYSKYQPATMDYGIYFNQRDNDSAEYVNWHEHGISTGHTNPVDVTLVNREGRPAIQYNQNGIEMFEGQSALPVNFAEWNWISCNPGFNDVRSISTVASGPYLFACGFIVNPDYYLVFNRSNVPAPFNSWDFTEYLLNPGQNSFRPQLHLVGGLPCVVYTDTNNSDIRYLQAGSRTDTSAASWFLHTAVGSEGIDQHWNPSFALMEGRPAIAAGYSTIDFYWAGGQFPDSQDDWHSQTAVSSFTFGFNNALAVTGGLPIIAYSADYEGQNRLHIALAREKD